MKLVYPATFEKDGKYILVQFPDIPEAITQGATIEEAYEMAEEVLGLALEDKKDFPVATPVDIMQKHILSKQNLLLPIEEIRCGSRQKENTKTIRKI